MDWFDKKLAICVTANQEQISANFTWSLLNMYKPRSFCVLHEGQHIKANSLNRLTKRAMDWGADKILYLDVDMEFPAHTIPKLMMHDVDVVSGLYHLKVYPYSPIAGWTAKNGWRVNAEGKHWKEYYAPLPDDQLVELDWAGIGCLMVDKKVIEKLGVNCFRDTWDSKHGQRKKGHDIYFCENAKKAGFKVFCDTSIDCNHRYYMAINKLFVQAYHECGMEQKMYEKVQQWSSESAWWDEKWLEVGVRKKEQVHIKEADYMVKNTPDGVEVADMGCGIGYVLYRLAKEKDCKPYGYDFSNVAIFYLNQIGIDGEVCDVRTFTPNGASYHTVVCSHLLEHIDDEHEKHLVETIAKMAKNQAFFSVPDEEKQWIEHKRIYDKKMLRKLLKPYFKEVTVRTLGDGILAHCIVDPDKHDSDIITSKYSKGNDPMYPAYWDNKVDEYVRKNKVIGRLDVLERIIGRIPKGATVGEFGCGYSAMLGILKKKKDCKVYGYDFSSKAIKAMKEEFDIDGEVADILTYNPNGARYHTMILSHVLEHFDGDDIDKVLKVISSMAEKQAIIVVPQEKIENMAGIQKITVEKEHKRIYSVPELKKTLKPYFDSVEIETIKPQGEEEKLWVNRHIIAFCQKHPTESEEVQVGSRVSVGENGNPSKTIPTGTA